MSSFWGRFTATSYFRLTIIVLLGVLVACAAEQPQNIHSALETDPEAMTAVFTPAQIEQIQFDYAASPTDHSQKFGEYLLWKMHRHSPEVAWEFAQIPEISDGISVQEAEAMRAVLQLVEEVNLPDDIWELQQDDISNILISWTSRSDKTRWEGMLVEIRGQNKPESAVPRDFEDGDALYEELLGSGLLRWETWTDGSDIDGISVKLHWPRRNEPLKLFVNGRSLTLTLGETLFEGKTFDHSDGLDGRLTVRNLARMNASAEALALRDMVLAGRGDHKFSASLQALLWAYMDGTFTDGDNPLKSYEDNVKFVRSIWNFQGPRWQRYDDIIGRLNTPELVALYLDRNITYFNGRSTFYPQSAERTIETRLGDCKAYSIVAYESLKKAGYPVYLFTMDVGSLDGHTITVVEVEKPGAGKELYGIANRMRSAGILYGPFSSEREIIAAYGYQGKPSVRETLEGMKRRFRIR